MKTLGENIKSLRKINIHSQKDLAVLLNVSQTSIAHYEKGTRQPNLETLLSISNLYNISLDELLDNKKTIETTEYHISSIKEEQEKLLQFLLNKEEKHFIAHVKKNLLPNLELKIILNDLLTNILYSIGRLWENGEISEADEHYSTNSVRKVLHFINIEYSTNLKKKKAVSFVASKDKHTIGMEVVNTVLELNNIETIYLGNDLDIGNIEKIITESKPDYIFISVTLSTYLNNVNILLQKLEKITDDKTLIFVGGQGVEFKQDFAKYENVNVIDSSSNLLELIEDLMQ